MLLAVLFQGIITGFVYALVALGFALIYNATKIFHIAHGALFVLAGYLAYSLSLLNLNIWVILIPTTIIISLIGLAIYLFVYAPILKRNGELFICMISSIGVMIVIEGLFTLIYGNQTKSLIPGALVTFQIGILSVSYIKIIIIILCAASFGLIYFYLNKFKFGKAILALADNEELAETIGINIQSTRYLVFMLGSALVAVASFFVSIDTGIRPDSAFFIILISATAVLIGTHGYLPGTIVAGIGLGIIENIAIYYLGTSWKNSIIFSVLIIILIFMPNGLFSKIIHTRGE